MCTGGQKASRSEITEDPLAWGPLKVCQEPVPGEILATESPSGTLGIRESEPDG